ncbi:hypothetical protein BH10PSE19_BH10PSE19_05950 [soil metagenome]
MLFCLFDLNIECILYKTINMTIPSFKQLLIDDEEPFVRTINSLFKKTYSTPLPLSRYISDIGTSANDKLDTVSL